MALFPYSSLSLPLQPRGGGGTLLPLPAEPMLAEDYSRGGAGGCYVIMREWLEAAVSISSTLFWTRPTASSPAPPCTAQSLPLL